MYVHKLACTHTHICVCVCIARQAVLLLPHLAFRLGHMVIPDAFVPSYMRMCLYMGSLVAWHWSLLSLQLDGFVVIFSNLIKTRTWPAFKVTRATASHTCVQQLSVKWPMHGLGSAKIKAALKGRMLWHALQQAGIRLMAASGSSICTNFTATSLESICPMLNNSM